VKPRVAIPEPHSGDREYTARALPQYQQAVAEAGGEPVIVPLDETPEGIAKILATCQAALLPGSRADIAPSKYGQEKHEKTAPADALRDAADELVLQDAFNMRKPLLGICYGLQSLNVWRTGTLVQHIESGVNHEAGRAVVRAHDINVEAESRLARILADAPHTDLHPSPDFTAMRLKVNSSHHQAPEVPGDGLRIAARCPEDGVVEALEGTAPEHFVLGVQWHPERTTAESPASRAIFKALVEAAKQR
jgi:putative glutamine amidotransferase